MPHAKPISLAGRLIARRSVTPADDGALDVLEQALHELGFRCERMAFEAAGEARIDNLYARHGDSGPNFCFAGHTDVVPSGPETLWRIPPFSGAVEEGRLWGRGAADMKGAIAAFVEAADRAIASGAAVGGSISLLITGDEEGPAVNGTCKVLEALATRGERIDHCLVGEPSSVATLGDMIKVGRRGSMNCWLTVHGRRGHVAYPDRAANPIPKLIGLLDALRAPLDAGYPRFPASNLEITDLHVGNPAANVIPEEAVARFNIRFNPTWSAATLEAEIRRRLADAAQACGASFDLRCVASGEAFLTEDAGFIALISGAVTRRTGRRPELSTSGGTSDARFIRRYAPVAEFGLVGATIHQIDEFAPVEDILALADIYEDILRNYFLRGGALA